jgi:two-component system, LytTR family, response regulator
MNTINQQQKILMLPTCKGIEVIDVRSIIRIEAMSSYSKLYFTGEKILVVAKVLSWFEDVLNPLHKADGFEEFFFVRIHRTHLINKCFIHQYIKGDGGKVKLYNGELIGVSKRKKKLFLKNWYMAA